jgi:hypothetical protein
MHRAAVLVLLVSGLVLCSPQAGHSQAPARPAQVELLQNYPNPFNPATTIPFRLSEALFADGHRPVVSLRIYNVLAQLVAIPTMQGSGEPMDGLALDCRDLRDGYCSFSAYWDGKYQGTDRDAASGVYVYQLVVDGQRFSRRMVVLK